MKRVLVIFGAAPNTVEDFESLIAMGFRDYDVLAVGIDALSNLKNEYIRYFATYHPMDLASVRFERDQMKRNVDFKIISHKPYPDKEHSIVGIIIPIDLQKEPSGSSALLGVLGAMKEGYEKMVLCGCPLTGKNTKEQPYSVFRTGWLFHEKAVLGKVKSMSGWTKEILGSPDKEWLEIV